MTTIAFDGNMLAADTMISGAYTLQQSYSKVRVTPSQILAAAGTLANIVPWMYWYLDEDREEYPFTTGATEEPHGDAFIVLDRLLFTIDVYEPHCKRPVLQGLTCPYAVGSGAAFAMGAMLAGKSAAKAIEIAAQLDPLTGGEIVYYPKKIYQLKTK